MKRLMQLIVLPCVILSLTSCQSHHLFQGKHEQVATPVVTPTPAVETLPADNTTQEENAAATAAQNLPAPTPPPASNIIPVGRTKEVKKEDLQPIKKKIVPQKTEESETVSEKPNTE